MPTPGLGGLPGSYYQYDDHADRVVNPTRARTTLMTATTSTVKGNNYTYLRAADPTITTAALSAYQRGANCALLSSASWAAVT